MRIMMVIPTYWTREKREGLKENDIAYDHPTPIDEEGTLGRTLKSMKVLERRDFELIIIAVPTAEDIEDRVERRVREIVSSSRVEDIKTYLFGPSHLNKLRAELEELGDKMDDLLSIYGYSPVRNVCIFIPFVLGADVVILIDDDEIFEDPRFIDRAVEHIGREYEGREVLAIAGYYLQADGDYRVKKPFKPYMYYWDQYEKMNEAFEMIIGREPRLKPTPFVFGGNMVLHRDIIKEIPFDPGVPRGEDIDYLINAKMFGFEFFLDNELRIKHLPPPKPHPLWKQLRMDMFRFVWEREKLRKQRPVPGMRTLSPEDLDPYPGGFLKEDLDEKIVRASELLAIEYLSKGERENAQEAINNILLLKKEAIPEYDPFENLLWIKKRWKSLLQRIEGNLERFKEVTEVLA